MRFRLVLLLLGFFLLGTVQSPCTDNTYVRFTTNLGNIDVQMLTDEAPKTVANFLSYVDSGAYDDLIVNRSIPGFVIQGGGYSIPGDAFPVDQVTSTTTNLLSEAGVSNIAGTLAMALSDGPNTGTNQWFFNLVNNSSLLDGTSDGGPFTVFGRVASAGGLAVMQAIGNEPTYDGSSIFNADFTNLPLINYTSTLGLQVQNFVTIYSISVLAATDFPTWQNAKFTTTQLSEATVSGPTATPDNDGVPNLLKYVFDINPLGSMNAADCAALPVVGTSGGGQYLTLTYRQYAQMVGVTIYVQTSSDLQTWTTVSNPTITQTGTDSNGDAIMQAEVPVSGTAQFIRLNITQP